MVKLSILNEFIKETYNVEQFEDYCFNGIQVEGKEEINTIIFGVSFNKEFLKKAISYKADAIIVHHGIFGKNFFSLKGVLKDKVKILLDNGISLIGIHLPMDAHPEYGHNAQLFKYIDAKILESFSVGFIGGNSSKKSIEDILDIFHEKLHFDNKKYYEKFEIQKNNVFNIKTKYGFQILQNGPMVPEKIAIISGGSSSYYEKAIELGVDTFICGEIKEQVPAISKETKTNFINIGHNNSEKPGVIKLMEIINSKFNVETKFINIDNFI